MLDDPGVARLSQDDELAQCSLLPCDSGVQAPTDAVLTSSALTIEEEYRHKLQDHKKKKRKKDDEGDPSESKKKKIKGDNAEPGEEVKKKKVKSKDEVKVKVKNDGKVKSDTELESDTVKPTLEKKSESDKESPDNVKELFKDFKDGRIKPGAIIKSKDIAKKEGVVKKEPKPPPESKPKPKPNNPFGKINKQENSKLTTLIAKAKESRVGLVPNSEVGDSPKLSLGSIIVGGDIGTGIKSVHETDEDEKWEPREKWESSPWEGAGSFDPTSEREENTPIREEEPVKSEREEMEDVIVCEKPPSVRSNERSGSMRSEDRTPIVEEIIPPPTPRAPEIKQERATPNLSAWFKAFGAPKTSSSSCSNKKNEDEDESSDIAEGSGGGEYPHSMGGSGSDYSRPHSQQGLPVQDKVNSQPQSPASSSANAVDENCPREENGSASPMPEDPLSSTGDCRTPGSGGAGGEIDDVVEVVADESNDSIHSTEHMGQPMLPSSPKSIGSPQPPLSPQPPISPEKPPETPWYQKLEEKMEDEPIWGKNKVTFILSLVSFVSFPLLFEC